MRATIATLLGLAIGLTCGCSLIEEFSTTQCDVDADCPQGEGEQLICQEHVCVPFDRFRCFFEERQPVQSTEVDGFLVDFFDFRPAANASVRLCQGLDPECQSVYQTTTSADGTFSLVFPDAFDGYLEFRTAANDRPVGRVAHANWERAIVALQEDIGSLAVFGFFGELSGVEFARTVVPGLPASFGWTFVIVNDCFGNRAEGLRFYVEEAPDARTLYFRNGLEIDLSATQTDSFGIGAVIDLQADRRYTLVVTEAETDRVITRIPFVALAESTVGGFVDMLGVPFEE